MKLAIVGSGISGLVAATALQKTHAVTLFEAADYAGGHTHTVDVEIDGERHAIDTGFIVHNDRTYPCFQSLLRHFNLTGIPTSMGFSVRCDRTNTEYSGTTLSGLFAQKANLLRPAFWQMLRDIRIFNKWGKTWLDSTPPSQTVAEFLVEHRFSSHFANLYLLPMGAAIWSCPIETFRQFPIRFILEFYNNHGLLQIFNRPTWRVIPGGAKTYVERMTDSLGSSLRLSTPVKSIQRHPQGVLVESRVGSEHFDEVILACHSDQALQLLTDLLPIEQEILSEFPYSVNHATLHTDSSVLPVRRACWSSWNYHIRSGEDRRPVVTYNMNILQHLKSAHTFCVTLNAVDQIDPTKILGEYVYHHPIFTVRRAAMQRRHAELIRLQRISYCGAYWGNGFHEDGVVSALAVCRAFGVVPPWAVGLSQNI